MIHHFVLHCLGGPALLTAAGEQVRFRTRKHLALLVRLALEPGKRFTRDYLADLLWPDSPPKHANHSLAQGLSVIKAKIAREAVVIQRATVGLAPGWIDADVNHLSDGNAHVSGPFLDGFEIPAARPFEEWTTDLCIAVAQVVDVRVNPSGRQTDRGALDHHRFARNLGFDDRKTLSKRMIRMLRRRIRP